MNETRREKIIDWLQLINFPNVGPITFYKLLEKYGSARRAIENLVEKAHGYTRQDAQNELKKTEEKGINIICRDDEW